jgi:hypothetical protein
MSRVIKEATSRGGDSWVGGSLARQGVPVLKHRLVAGVVLALFVSGCAAGRAFRKGDEAARAGDWDAAVVHYTAAVQENPD